MKVGDVVKEGATLTTAAGESIILVFSNGATVQLEPNSELQMVVFRQAQLPDTVRVAELTVEPSRSQTRMVLLRGGIIASSKQRGDSTFTVDTPIGELNATAGIFRLQVKHEYPETLAVEVSTLTAPVSFTEASDKKAHTTVPPERTYTFRRASKEPAKR